MTGPPTAIMFRREQRAGPTSPRSIDGNEAEEGRIGALTASMLVLVCSYPLYPDHHVTRLNNQAQALGPFA